MFKKCHRQGPGAFIRAEMDTWKGGQDKRKIINKTYAKYRQRELNEKDVKTGKALGKHVINLYSTGISRWLKIKDVKKLRQDTENDPIIKDQMANLGCLLCVHLMIILPLF